MQLITNYLQNLERLKAKVPDFAREAILNNRGIIVNLVKFDQLSQGKNSYGQPLSWAKGTGYYSPYTQAYADRDGVRTPKIQGAPYNFSYSGETLDNMNIEFVDTSNFTYKINTVRFKQDLLEVIYGEIFELTDEHNEWVNKNIIEPYVADKIQQEMFNF